MNRTIKEFLADILEWIKNPILGSPSKSEAHIKTHLIDGSTYNLISVYDDGDGYAYGTNVVLNGGSHLILGAGESPLSIYEQNIDNAATSEERLYLSSDNEIYFYSGANAVANRKTMIYNSSGDLAVPGSIISNGKDVFNSSNQSSGTLPGARLPLMLKTVSATSAKFSVNAGATYYKDVALTAPSGYELVGCIGASTAHNQAAYIGGMFKSATNTIRVSGKNNASSNWTDMTVTVYGLYALSNIW